MGGSGGVVPSELTPGTDAQVQIVAPGSDAPTDGVTEYLIEEQSIDTIKQKRDKAAEIMKKRRPKDCLTHWASRRIAMVSPNVLVYQALKEKINLAIKRSSQRVAEQFYDAMTYHPKFQNLKMLKAKAKR
ncbi:hypothetical protein H5410_021577 [Solanum commersonii]|uniref:Uncharacterized protein n=1 Tax=Solanum commersonii TaxID=4109 RepID=A0A9J5ZEN0_SOLCO|nr:hypothetical protein H5410_021577 [Solanum commersonii]